MTTNVILCSCSIKTNISTEEESPNIVEMIKTSFENTNFAIVKCYNIILDFKNLTSNIGFWFVIILLFSHVI